MLVLDRRSQNSRLADFTAWLVFVSGSIIKNDCILYLLVWVCLLRIPWALRHGRLIVVMLRGLLWLFGCWLEVCCTSCDLKQNFWVRRRINVCNWSHLRFVFRRSLRLGLGCSVLLHFLSSLLFPLPLAFLVQS